MLVIICSAGKLLRDVSAISGIWYIPFALFACSLHSLATHAKHGVQMGSLRGRPRRGRFPSGLVSENRFMVKGALKAPGAT